jgi:cytochrome c biogenesis protein CcmG, thiol:disulfide interchange protein DsbE
MGLRTGDTESRVVVHGGAMGMKSAAVAFIGVLIGCTPQADSSKVPDVSASVGGIPAIGGRAPEFVVAALGADSVHVGGAAAQPVTLVNIWATWCGPCKAEFPELQALHATYSGRGLRVLAISIDSDGDAEVAASARAMAATFLIGREPGDEVRGRFGAVGIPETWLVSKDGKLLWRHSGAIPAGDAGVRAAIEAALAPSKGA